jgi:hypothetical protein
MGKMNRGGSGASSVEKYVQTKPQIPFERNLQNFVPREDLFEFSISSLQEGIQSCTLGTQWSWVSPYSSCGPILRSNGLMSRKSRIAVEYLYRLTVNDPTRAKFWVSDLDSPHFYESFRLIAEEIPQQYLQSRS